MNVSGSMLNVCYYFCNIEFFSAIQSLTSAENVTSGSGIQPWSTIQPLRDESVEQLYRP